MVQYARTPLQAGLVDKSSYVRRNALMAAVKLYKLDPDMFEGIIKLYKLDPDMFEGIMKLYKLHPDMFGGIMIPLMIIRNIMGE